jgi:predicted RNA-binding Zn-ribbon protein involved in translation (DUF1610 family)
MESTTCRPCPLCGDNRDVEWLIEHKSIGNVVMSFSCPACEGQGTIYAQLGDVTPISED